MYFICIDRIFTHGNADPAAGSIERDDQNSSWCKYIPCNGFSRSDPF